LAAGSTTLPHQQQRGLGPLFFMPAAATHSSSPHKVRPFLAYPDKAQPHPVNGRLSKVGRILSDDQVTTPRQSRSHAPLAYPGYGLTFVAPSARGDDEGESAKCTLPSWCIAARCAGCHAWLAASGV